MAFSTLIRIFSVKSDFNLSNSSIARSQNKLYFCNNNNLSLANFLKVFKIEFKGTQHNALADTLNLVYLYDAFLKNTEIVVNEYRKTLGMYRHLPEPIHLAIEKLSRKENVSAEDFESYVRDSLK